MTNPWLTIALLVVLSLAGCTPSVRASHIVLATTTSVGNSGLLDEILPAWQQETGVEVRVALAGSGRAVGMMENGHADLVLSHAPAEFRASLPTPLFSGNYSPGAASSCGMPGVSSSNYDVTSDGARFLMVRDDDTDVVRRKIVVVLNWAEELKRMASRPV